MRHTKAEKMEMIRIVEASGVSVRQTLRELAIPRSTFYTWYRRYVEAGYDGLEKRHARAKQFWNRIPDTEKTQVVQCALAYPEKSPRELAWYMTDTRKYYISESSVYRILKAYDLITSPAYIVLSARKKFIRPTRQVHELWQTDFTYFKIAGWGWYYLSTVLDDYSRYILAWKLCATMAATDVKDTLDLAMRQTGVGQVRVRTKPRLLSDNGPCYVSGELQAYLRGQGMAHTRGAPYHPMTQGKIERYHRSLKNLINLDHYYQPEELERAIAGFVQYYNHQRYHESLKNVTPADVYYGRNKAIHLRRQRIKQQTLQQRRRYNLGKLA